MGTYFVPDNAEFRTADKSAWMQFLQEREDNSKWYSDETGCRAEAVQFRPVYAEPISVSAEVEKLTKASFPKFTASEEAYADTMDLPECGYDGSTQMLYVNGALYPVGASAINGITERAGIKADGWKKLRKFNPKMLSEVLNHFMKASKGNLTILVSDEKVRAVNGGLYAICPMTDVMETMNRWIQDGYPKARFVAAYASHDLAMWTLDLSEYTDDVLGNFPELKSNGFTPALIIRVAHTGTSSVSLKPALRYKGWYFPISEGISAPHKASGTASERTNSMREVVSNNFNSVFPSLKKCSAALDSLRGIQVHNAYNALLRAMKALNMPKEQGMEAAEQFHALFPDIATAYDCYMSVVDVLRFVTRDYPKDTRKQLAVAKSMERAIVGIDWAKLGNISGNFSW